MTNKKKKSDWIIVVCVSFLPLFGTVLFIAIFFGTFAGIFSPEVRELSARVTMKDLLLTVGAPITGAAGLFVIGFGITGVTDKTSTYSKTFTFISIMVGVGILLILFVGILMSYNRI